MTLSTDNTLLGTAIEKARKAYDEGDLAEAEKLCRQAVDAHPRSAAAIELLGRIDYDQQKFESAAKLFAEAVDLDPQNIDAIAGFASALVVCGESERAFDAIASYRAGLSLDEDAASMYNKFGTALRSIDRLDEAERAFCQALEMDAQNTEMHYNLALTYEKQNKLDKALTEFTKTIELDPKHLEALISLGRVYEEQGEDQRAISAYQRAIKVDPRAKEAHMNLGNMLVKYYMYDKAVICYRNALIIDPDEVSAYEGLGDSFKELNKLDESESYYKKACDLGSNMARHFLAVVKDVSTEIAPREYVKELFDGYAEDFEDHLRESLSYRTPELLYEAFTKVFNEKKHIRKAVDLGCGTGLAGVVFQPVASCIDGVDLSPSMLEQAKKKKIYSELHDADIVEYLKVCGIKYDLFIATDVFVYIGNLSPVLTAIRDTAARGAYLVFSVESTEEEGFLLQRTGRYAHSDSYIRKLARASGFDVVAMEAAQLRKEEDAWIQGRIIILRYPHRA